MSGTPTSREGNTARRIVPTHVPSYPLPAYLNFCPGGIRYDSSSTSREQLQSHYYALQNVSDPSALISQAAQADLQFNNAVSPGEYNTAMLPSLSLLAEAVLHPLTGVPAAQVKQWLDTALVQYAALDDTTRATLAALERQTTPTQIQAPPSAEGGSAHHHRTSSASSGRSIAERTTTTQLLHSLMTHLTNTALSEENIAPRPCGYVFRNGDIAWNCRTCQTDSTCVLCDKCFHASNHEGHEVFFHRTSPGGCCDCGDAEAWRIEGCCPSHRPRTAAAHKVAEDDDGAEELEAVRAAQRARAETEESLKTLPPSLRAALGIVIGAAVQCVTKAIDGSGVGADLSQWKYRWAEQIAAIVNGVAHEEEFVLLNKPKASYLTPHAVLEHAGRAGSTTPTGDEASGNGSFEIPEVEGYPQIQPTSSIGIETSQSTQGTEGWDGRFPDKFRLHLRLHNDDVHTYDEVIDALHKQRSVTAVGNEPAPAVRLIAERSTAETMTHHVDTDGQVTVKSYSNFSSCVAGFTRLKQVGLLCSIVSTPQVELELRAISVLRWLLDIVKLHPAVSGIVVHALVDITGGGDNLQGLCAVWPEARTICPWDSPQSTKLYTREALRKLWLLQQQQSHPASTSFYSDVPFRLPSSRLYKSPHALWGTMLAPSDYTSAESTHYYVIDTDLRKQQETVTLTTALYAHRLAGLNLVSGVALLQDGYVNLDGSVVSGTESDSKSGLISTMLTLPYKELHPILSKSSYIAPVSPLLIMLLLDPYPTKRFRSVLHSLWLNLLVDGRFKSRFAVALGAVAYRSLTTLFCAGIGTEQDSPIGFTVQIFTVKSLVAALNSVSSTRLLLEYDSISDGTPGENDGDSTASAASSAVRTRTLPVAISIVRVLHTNILGSTKEVRMLIEHTGQGHSLPGNSAHQALMQQFGGISSPNGYLPALVYQNGENPALDILPAAPDDEFLESRTTRHKRLPHILRDLEYVFEAGTTAMNLLLKNRSSPKQRVTSYSAPPPPVMDFCTAFARLLRLIQGMDVQKRKISGGHVEYEQGRWFEAFALSLNFACCRDALVESPTLLHLQDIGQLRSAMGNLFTALFREIKFYLYREDLLENGLLPASYLTNSSLPQTESPQRSTLHVPCIRATGTSGIVSLTSSEATNNTNNVALACPTGVKMTEAQLCTIEQALRIEYGPLVDSSSAVNTSKERNSSGVVMGDWLKVPHSPLSGDPLSFHLPLHRSLAKAITSLCSVAVPESERVANSKSWWKLPVLDGVEVENSNLPLAGGAPPQSYVAALLAPTLRTSNCKIVWQLPDASPEHLHMRRLRQYQISSILASVKVIHSLADLPIRCLAASAQIERHLWARNGSTAAGMAINYSTAPLCKSFRDLDLNLVQFSATGFAIGLGVRRVLSLLLNRFSMDGYLEDPKLQSLGAAQARRTPSNWKNPPRLQDPEYAPVLAESLFALVCILVTELPPPPPFHPTRDASSSDGLVTLLIRRELLHTLAAEPKTYSEAFKAALSGISRRDTSSKSTSAGGGDSAASSIRAVFSNVLRTIAKERPSSNPSTGAPVFELSAACSDEYDPTFYHLRRIEHQHAMDVVARLRRQKCKELASASRALRPQSVSSSATDYVLPLVPPPPEAHPRFLPARLILHLPAMDAAIRRKLLFALFGGEWLPPEPQPQLDETGRSLSNVSAVSSDDDSEELWNSSSSLQRIRARRAASGGEAPPGRSSATQKPDFGPRAVLSSSVSSLEVLQLLTLQIHTLESMANLHRSALGDSLDPESRDLSRSLNVNRYLARLVNVPESLEYTWALDPQNGPLPSAGSGNCRGSILGVLIALWEHSYCIMSADDSSENLGEQGGDSGARALASDGLKWILRFVHSLVDGATSVKAAMRSATEGVRLSPGSYVGPSTPKSGASTGWTLSRDVQETIQSMLNNVPKLWPDTPAAVEMPVQASVERPTDVTVSSSREILSAPTIATSSSDVNADSPGGGNGDKPSDDFKEKLAARKAAQMAALERMRKQQAIFVESLAASDGDDASDADAKESKSSADMDLEDDEDEDECIICRSGAQDSDSPLCFLGHVQRSRVLGLRILSEMSSNAPAISADVQPNWMHVGCSARVVGDRGCQLRSSPDLDSAPVACLPMGSIVIVLQSKVSPKYGILSRRVFVRHVPSEGDKTPLAPVEGWASVQSSQGYIILAPLTDLSFGRWSSTRPILRLCGHAAHLGCVDAHCLSLHQRANGDHPYDGRFAANIDEGEFLCPLCKQLSNVLVPRYLSFRTSRAEVPTLSEDCGLSSNQRNMSKVVAMLEKTLVTATIDPENVQDSSSSQFREAASRFGSQLHQAMDAPWEKTARKNASSRRWTEKLSKWDYEESSSDDDDSVEEKDTLCLGSTMKQLRELHISWALLGHGAASSEASARYTVSQSRLNPARNSWSMENYGHLSRNSEALDTRISDPWPEYGPSVSDSHPSLMEMKRVMLAVCGVFDAASLALGRLGTSDDATSDSSSLSQGSALLGLLLTDILDGKGSGLPYLLEPSDTSLADPICRLEWKVLTGCLSTIPCHVARDGMLSLRSEARATATSMWILHGLHTASDQNSTSLSLSGPQTTPPVPLAVRKLLEQDTSGHRLPLCLGTSNITEYLKSRTEIPGSQKSSFVAPLFRPAFASGILYMPLLAWDLNTLAGAVFSALLHSGIATEDDLMSATQLLLAGRMVQALVTPNGYHLKNCTEGGGPARAQVGVLPQFTPEDLLREGLALAKFQTHCLQIIECIEFKSVGALGTSAIPSHALLEAISSAVLPLARMLVLLLRTGFSILRSKPTKGSRHRSHRRSSAAEHMTQVLEDPSSMTCNSGLRLLKALGGPLPSDLIADMSNAQQHNGWLAIVDRWVTSVVNLESHHGSRGRCNRYDPELRKWTPKYVGGVDEQITHSCRQSNGDTQLTASAGNLGESMTESNPRITSGVFLNPESVSTSEENEGRIMESNGDDAGFVVDRAIDDSIGVNEDASDEDEEMDDETVNDDNLVDNFVVENFRGANEDMNSDDEEMTDDALGNQTFGLVARRATSPSSDSKDDEEDTSDRSIVDDRNVEDNEFADVSNASIINFQPTLLARECLGQGPRGSPLDLIASSKILCDMSHLGVVHHSDTSGSGFIRLPYSFVELYGLVSKVRGDSQEDTDDSLSGEAVICLLTGAVLRSGSPRRALSRSPTKPPGACTVHARKVGSGIGVFFLVQKCIVLLVHNNKSAYSPSLYVDENGEEDPGLRRGRPLFLNESRLQALETLWRQNGVPREVAQIRSTSDRVIRDNWY